MHNHRPLGNVRLAMQAETKYLTDWGFSISITGILIKHVAWPIRLPKKILKNQRLYWRTSEQLAWPFS